MAESLVQSWWKRFRGVLEPSPCPFSQASVLESSLRKRFASPEQILGAFCLARGSCVLEIGPGVGFYSLEALRMVGDDGRLICLDIQRAMLQEARRRISGTTSGEVGFIQGSADQLPLRDASVDHVLLITVLGELPNRPMALAEIRRVLRPGGRLSVSEQLPDPDYLTRRTLRRELSSAGFTEESTRGLVVYASTWSSP